MTMTLIGTCYSHHWDGTCSHRAIVGFDNGEWRLTRRQLSSPDEALRYGKRLFYRLERSGKWEMVVPQSAIGTAAQSTGHGG